MTNIPFPLPNNLTPDQVKQAQELWKNLDDLAISDPKKYKETINRHLSQPFQPFVSPVFYIKTYSGSSTYSSSFAAKTDREKTSAELIDAELTNRHYINVCESVGVNAPKNEYDSVVPVMVSKERAYRDRACSARLENKLYKVYDTVFHPSVLERRSKDKLFEGELLELIFHCINETFGVSVQKNRYKIYTKPSYKGPLNWDITGREIGQLEEYQPNPVHSFSLLQNPVEKQVDQVKKMTTEEVVRSLRTSSGEITAGMDAVRKAVPLDDEDQGGVKLMLPGNDKVDKDGRDEDNTKEGKKPLIEVIHDRLLQSSTQTTDTRSQPHLAQCRPDEESLNAGSVSFRSNSAYAQDEFQVSIAQPEMPTEVDRSADFQLEYIEHIIPKKRSNRSDRTEGKNPETKEVNAVFYLNKNGYVFNFEVPFVQRATDIVNIDYLTPLNVLIISISPLCSPSHSLPSQSSTSASLPAETTELSHLLLFLNSCTSEGFKFWMVFSPPSSQSGASGELKITDDMVKTWLQSNYSSEDVDSKKDWCLEKLLSRFIVEKRMLQLLVPVR
ncbi:hypothetical protein BKA69DRAFT_1036178 [Paraphysoderma sedebokerense]|nr:hypothetical protein BKA69DRAFT_1036178 [Paraphysoderma sedebokerense]